MVQRRRSRGTKPAWQTEIAQERIEILFRNAGKEFPRHPELSDRYVEIARKIAMKFNVSMPSRLKHRFCKKCGAFLVPGESCRIRLNSEKHYRIQTCGLCGDKVRHPYVREIKKKGELKKPVNMQKS